MRALALDFAAEPPRAGWPAWLLLALGLVFVADLARSYSSLQGEIARLETRLASTGRTAGESSATTRINAPEEFAAARAVVERFAKPWPALFAAIESVRVDGVSLSSIEPDPAAGYVLIVGEAQSYLAVLTYVAQLGMQPGLARVHLLRHERRDAQRKAPVSFSVAAYWGRG